MEDHNIDNNSFSSKRACDRQLVKKLATACEGLLWLSESDYPWEVIYWQDVTNCDRPTLLQRYSYHPETKVVTKTVDSFFAPAIQEQEWHEATEKAETKRYQNLYNLLKENLQDVRVYLVGEVEIDVYVLGKIDDNAVAGLSTKIVET